MGNGTSHSDRSGRVDVRTPFPVKPAEPTKSPEEIFTECWNYNAERINNSGDFVRALFRTVTDAYNINDTVLPNDVLTEFAKTRWMETKFRTEDLDAAFAARIDQNIMSKEMYISKYSKLAHTLNMLHRIHEFEPTLNMCAAKIKLLFKLVIHEIVQDSCSCTVSRDVNKLINVLVKFPVALDLEDIRYCVDCGNSQCRQLLQSVHIDPAHVPTLQTWVDDRTLKISHETRRVLVERIITHTAAENPPAYTPE